MEFTPAEITQLLQCAGFECTCLRGIWTVRDPSTGELLPLSADAVVENWPFLRRVVAAANHADDAFLWWVEARKTERSPDAKAIRRLLDEIYSREWPRRSNRFYTQGELIGTAVARCTQPNQYVLYGPYVPLPPGSYTVWFEVRRGRGEARTGPCCRCEVYTSAGLTVASVDVDFSCSSEESQRIPLRFSLPDMAFGVEFRVYSYASGTFFDVPMHVALDAQSALLSAA